METIAEHAQSLVYDLISLMPSVYQKDSLKAVFGLFLEAQGHPLPEQTQVKSPSSLSRFFNIYSWSLRDVIRTTRQSILQLIAQQPLRKDTPLRIIIDLTTLPKRGKFLHLSNPTDDPEQRDPWVRILNGKRGLHLVVLYLEIGQWRIPWSFRIWKGKGHSSPSQLACKLLNDVPLALSKGRTVIVQADTEFGTVDFITAVKKHSWRAVVGIRCNRKLSDGRTVQQLYRNCKRGQLLYLEGIDIPLTISWFWLKRADGKQELRFVASNYPYSGVYLIQLGRRRWAIESFFKTIKHRFGLHCFGQSTRIGVYRWLVLSLIAYLLAHWINQWLLAPDTEWKAASDFAIFTLFPSILWIQLLKLIESRADIAALFGFEIVLKRLPDWAYR